MGVGLLAILSGAVTYGILSGLIPWTPGRGGLIVLLLINLTLGLSLGALIAWRLVRLWTERKSGRDRGFAAIGPSLPQIELDARRHGDSVNTWILRAATNALPGSARRDQRTAGWQAGTGHHVTGWMNG